MFDNVFLQTHDRSNCSQINMNGMHYFKYNEEGFPRGIPMQGSFEKAYFTCSPLPFASKSTRPLSHQKAVTCVLRL